MIIEIINAEEAETEHLQAVISRVLRHQHVDNVKIFISGREANGWIEYLIVFTYESGSKLTVGCIQRKPGAEVEFHS